MMRYGRDYGDRGFLDRAASTVRGWLGHGRDYDGSFRTSGWNENRGGYRRGYDAGYDRGYRGGTGAGQGGGSWSGRNADWDRTPGRAGQGYRTGGYQPRHGAWDVDWQNRDRGMSGGGMNRGGMGGGGYDRGYREVTTIRPSYDPRDDVRTRGVRMSGDSMNRGVRPGRYDQDMDPSGGSMAGGMRPGGGMLGNSSGAYGFDRFRSNYGSGFGGQYYTGYGTGSPRG